VDRLLEDLPDLQTSLSHLLRIILLLLLGCWVW
jgi:hypothetical protein